jgi:hypothetical protein
LTDQASAAVAEGSGDRIGRGILVRTVAILGIVIASVGALHGCAQPPSNECAAITHEEAVSVADVAKQHMLSRSRLSVQQNFATSSAWVDALNDGRGFGAQVAYRGKDGTTLVALIHEDCYVGWTEREPDYLGSDTR